MNAVPYTSLVRSLMHAMVYISLDICYAVGMINRYQSNHRPEYWTAVKHIFKYLRRTKDYMLTYGGSNLIPVGYTYSDFMLDMDSRKSIFEYVFTLKGAIVSWRSIKQRVLLTQQLKQSM